MAAIVDSDGARSVSAGTNTPPAIAATPVPAIPAPIGVNGYSSVPAPANGQQATEALYTNGVHPYQGTSSSKASKATETRPPSFSFTHIYLFSPSPVAQSPAALDPLQQAYAGMQHYTGWFTSSSSFYGTFSGFILFCSLSLRRVKIQMSVSGATCLPTRGPNTRRKDQTYISMQQHDIILHYHMTEHRGKQLRLAVKQGHLRLMGESHCSGDRPIGIHQINDSCPRESKLLPVRHDSHLYIIVQ